MVFAVLLALGILLDITLGQIKRLGKKWGERRTIRSKDLLNGRNKQKRAEKMRDRRA